MVVMETCCERLLLSENVFQMQAISDTLPATEQQTQLDNTTMNTTAVTDNVEDILPTMTTAQVLLLLLNLTMQKILYATASSTNEPRRQTLQPCCSYS